jgi:hypothetical protein
MDNATNSIIEYPESERRDDLGWNLAQIWVQLSVDPERSEADYSLYKLQLDVSKP